MNKITHAAIGLVVALFAAGPCTAAVTDAAANGFSVAQTIHIAAKPDKVYAELIKPAHWWSSTHTFSHDAANLSLDAKAGGCWCGETKWQGRVAMRISVSSWVTTAEDVEASLASIVRAARLA